MIFIKKYENIYEELKKSFLFRGCDDEIFDEFVNKNTCTPIKYKPSELIYTPKNYKKSIGIVLSGKIYVHSSNESKPTLLRMLEKGDFFGAAALFCEDEEYATTISAKTACDILYISDEIMYSLIENDKAVMKNYIVFLSERIRFLNKKVKYYTAGSAEKKLALYLLRLPRNEDAVKLDLPMSSLADLLDTGRASLYRAFDKLEKDGFIKRFKNIIQLTDIEKMSNYYN